MTPKRLPAPAAKKASTTGDNNARRNHIEERWNEFKKTVLAFQGDMPREQVDSIRNVFFAGAWAMIHSLRCDQTKPADIRLEMEAFANRVNRAHEKRKREGTL